MAHSSDPSRGSPLSGPSGALRMDWPAWLRRWRNGIIAGIAVAGLTAHLVLRFGVHASPALSRLPLLIILVAGGVPLVLELLRNVWRREFGSDLLAGISI
ncbi:MAG: hypothetical protein EOP86_22865, partial [Verrucomicrobiaceae bacterium]